MCSVRIFLSFLLSPSLANAWYDDVCGIREARSRHANDNVIGGEDVTRPWPWMASLQFFNEWDMTYDHVCGATLLSKEWLVTAAHCLDVRVSGPNRDDPGRYLVMIGGTRLYSLTGEEAFLGVRQFYLHEEWIPESSHGYPNDIALVRLDEFVEPETYVAPVCLPDSADNFDDAPCFITGWGYIDPDLDYYPDVLQEALVGVLSLTSCQEAVPLPILSTHLCSGGADPPKICNGDSGGPLLCLAGDRWRLAGINSWTYNFCEGYPSVHTKTSSYLDWIKHILQSGESRLSL